MVTSGERSANSTRGLHGRWLAVALSVSLSLGTASPASQDVADEGGEAVATVGDIVLSRVELERNEKRLGFFGTLDGVPADKRRARALRHLVEDTLLAAEAQRRGIEVGESTIDDALAELVQVLSGRNQSLDRMFAATGLDRESLREQARRDIAVQLLFSELLTPEEYDAVYEARHREFDGTRYRVSHLVLRPDGTGNASALVPEARRIRAGIVAGEITFAAAAARHSAAPSRRRGGDIGFIPRHGPFAEEFAREIGRAHV